MTILEAAILGLVQGLFMFLPVSSTAHLVIAQHLMIRGGSDLPAPDSPEMILFDLVVHVGTLVSIAAVFRPSLFRFTSDLVRDGLAWAGVGRAGRRELLFLRLFMLGMLTVLATGIVGLTFKALFERVFATPLILAGTLTLTGILLWWTDRLTPRRVGLRGIGLRTATVIGVAQGFALVPGLSRSALTIVFGLFAGLKRRWAAEYSFFVAIPTITAATLVQAVEVWRTGGLGGVDWTALAVGFWVAALVGIAALKVVLALLYRARLKVFSFYVWALAAVIALGFLDDLL